MRAFDRIPELIWQDIVLIDASDDKGYGFVDMERVRLLSQTCSALHRSAEKFIFRSVHARSLVSFHRLMDLIARRPYLADYIYRVKLDISEVFTREAQGGDRETRGGSQQFGYKGLCKLNADLDKAKAMFRYIETFEIVILNEFPPDCSPCEAVFQALHSRQLVTAITFGDLPDGALLYRRELVLGALQAFPSLKSVKICRLNALNFVECEAWQYLGVETSEDPPKVFSWTELVLEDCALSPEFLGFLLKASKPEKFWYSENVRMLAPGTQTRDYYDGLSNQLQLGKDYIQKLALWAGANFRCGRDIYSWVNLLDFTVLTDLCIDMSIVLPELTPLLDRPTFYGLYSKVLKHMPNTVARLVLTSSSLIELAALHLTDIVTARKENISDVKEVFIPRINRRLLNPPFGAASIEMTTGYNYKVRLFELKQAGIRVHSLNNAKRRGYLMQSPGAHEVLCLCKRRDDHEIH